MRLVNREEKERIANRQRTKIGKNEAQKMVKNEQIDK